MSAPAILDDSIHCLRQAAELARRLGRERFTRRHPAFFSASIGGHVRHNVDHYLNFFRGLGEGRIDYENRERDVRTETDPAFAIERLGEITSRLAELANHDLDAPCTVRVNADSDDATDPAHWSGSTIRRELQFLLGHTIHHDAQIAAICRLEGVEPPPDFGMAPSTIRYRRRIAGSGAASDTAAQSCAP